MKVHLLSFVALIATTMIGSTSLRAQEIFHAGETTIDLDVTFGIREVKPSHVTVPPNERVKLDAPAQPVGGIWFKDGREIAGATNSSLVIDLAKSSDSGTYQYHFTAASRPDATSQAVILNVRPLTNLVNLSTRGFAGQGDQTMICGFVVTGKSDPATFSTILIRAVGPTLTRFGVNGVLQEPKIAIFSADGKPYTEQFAYTLSTDSLTHEQHIQQVTTRVGAFALTPGAKDAVELRPFLPGLYTVQITGAGTSTGNVLLEVYESPE